MNKAVVNFLPSTCTLMTLDENVFSIHSQEQYYYVICFVYTKWYKLLSSMASILSLPTAVRHAESHILPMLVLPSLLILIQDIIPEYILGTLALLWALELHGKCKKYNGGPDLILVLLVGEHTPRRGRHI